MELQVKKRGCTSSTMCVLNNNSYNYTAYSYTAVQTNNNTIHTIASHSHNSYSLFSSKKSQITLFIILGVVILALVLSYLYFTQMKKENLIPTQTLSEDIKPIKTFVDQCLFDTSLKAVMLTAIQGGSISLSQKNMYTESETGKITYGLKLKAKTLPTKIDMQNEIESYINTILPECTSNFSKFNKDVSAGKLKSTVKIADDKVAVTLDYPITVNSNTDNNAKIDKFQANIPLRLGHLHTIAEKIIDDQISYGILINLDKLHEYDVKVDLSPLDDKTMIFLISDVKNANIANMNKANADNQQPETDLLFMTAIQFQKNNPPTITIDKEFVVKDGMSFSTKAIIGDEEAATVKLSDDTALFGIEQDGTISFTPEIPGEYDVTITAQDKEGMIATKNVK